MRSLLPVFALALAAIPATAQTATPVAPATAPAVTLTETQWILYGRQVTEWFFAGQTDSLLAHSSPDVLERTDGAKHQ
jgi:hypothetical protein